MVKDQPDESIRFYFAIPCSFGGVSYITPDLLLSTLSPRNTLLNISVLETVNLVKESNISDLSSLCDRNLAKFMGLPEYAVLFTPRSQINSSQNLASPCPYQFKDYKITKVTQFFGHGKSSIKVPFDIDCTTRDWSSNSFYASLSEHSKKANGNKSCPTEVSEVFPVFQCTSENSSFSSCTLFQRVQLRTIVRTHCSTPWDILEFVKDTVRSEAFADRPVRNFIFSGYQPLKFAEDGVAWINIGPKSRTKTLDLRNSGLKNVKDPIEKGCACIACKNYTVGYIHHLVHVHEMNGTTLIAIHNLYTLTKFLEEIETKDASSPEFLEEKLVAEIS